MEAEFQRDTLLRHARHHDKGSESKDSTKEQSEIEREYPIDGRHGDVLSMEGTDDGLEERAMLTAPSPEQDDTFQDPMINLDSSIDTHLGFDASNWLLENDFLDSLADLQAPQSSNEHHVLPMVHDLRHIWYVPILRSAEPEIIGHKTVSQQADASQEGIDEAYRASLPSKLVPSARNEPLPSIDFLNICIRLFLNRFSSILPLIHGPTFRATSHNSLLVLSICSAGTLLIGSEKASRMGAMLFERVNAKGMTTPWEIALSQHPEQARSNLKVAAIGQTFALLSADPIHRVTANTLHGSMIASARLMRLFDETPPLELAGMSSDDLDKTWRTWASTEEMKRIASLLLIHDAEIAALFHQEPIFRHNVRSPPMTSSAELFAAPTAMAWAAKYHARENTSTPSSEQHLFTDMLNAHVILSGIGASICESRHLDLLSAQMIAKHEANLITWHASSGSFHKGQTEDCQVQQPFCQMPLWHYTFISLAADLNQLEIAVGREGTTIAPSTHEYVASWASSPRAQRCLLHALYVQRLVTSTTVGSLTPIHTARILFSAALCWYCYLLYRPSSKNLQPAIENDGSPSESVIESLLRFPEIRLLREENTASAGMSKRWQAITSDLRRILQAEPLEMKENTLCVLESTLRRLAIGGIARKFADIIQVFISGENEGAS